MANVRTVSNDFDSGTLIELFTLDCTGIGGSLYRWINGSLGSQPILFGGIEYFPFPVAANGFEMSGEGPLPRPKLTVSNSGGLATGLALAFNDILNARVERIRTFARFLDNGPTPDSSFFIGPEIYFINQKVAQTPETIEWELASKSDVEGKMIPGRTVLKTCQRTYRKWDKNTNQFVYSTCPYAGSEMFKKNDQPTSKPEEDMCSHYDSGCKLRFRTGPLPTWGFTAAARQG